MEIHIRNAEINDYNAVQTIMKQVQQMHIDWRPDIYKYSETLMPLEIYEQAVNEKTFFIAEYEGNIAGILFILFRHIESPYHITRNIIYVDSMAVDEKYRGKGIGHAFFDFLKDLRNEKEYDGIELQVNAKNKAAYEMYRNCGFTEKSISMELL